MPLHLHARIFTKSLVILISWSSEQPLWAIENGILAGYLKESQSMAGGVFPCQLNVQHGHRVLTTSSRAVLELL